MYQRILTAIDGSDRAERVLDTVERLALLTGTTVHVVHADESGIVYDQVVDLEDDGAAGAVVDRALARRAARLERQPRGHPPRHGAGAAGLLSLGAD